MLLGQDQSICWPYGPQIYYGTVTQHAVRDVKLASADNQESKLLSYVANRMVIIAVLFLVQKTFLITKRPNYFCWSSKYNVGDLRKSKKSITVRNYRSIIKMQTEN